MNNFRKLFSQYLDENNITQGEASEILGISQQAVSMMLNSDTKIRPSSRRKVLAAFPDFQAYYENGGSMPPDKDRYNLGVLLHIEENISDFVQIPEFLRLCRRVAREFDFYNEIKKEVEDLKKKLEE